MDLSTFFRVVFRSWYVILLAVLVTAGSSAYLVSRKLPVYRAVTTLEMRPGSLLTEPARIIDASEALERRTIINTAARRVSSSLIQEQVATALNIPIDIVVGTEISSIVVPDTNYIEIRVLSANPDLAAAIGNTIGEELRNSQPQNAFQIDIVDAAVPPTVPIEPQPRRTILLGVLFGLVLGIASALLGYVIENMGKTQTQPAVASVEDFNNEEEVSDPANMRANNNQTQQFIT